MADEVPALSSPFANECMVSPNPPSRDWCMTEVPGSDTLLCFIVRDWAGGMAGGGIDVVEMRDNEGRDVLLLDVRPSTLPVADDEEAEADGYLAGVPLESLIPSIRRVSPFLSSQCELTIRI